MTTTERRFTKKTYFSTLIDFIDSTELDELDTFGETAITKKDMKDFLEKELLLVSKKRSSKKEEAKKEAREEKKTALLKALKNLNGEHKTATELFVSVLPNDSVQLVTSLLYTLIDEGAVTKVVEKGKSYFFA